MEEPAISCDSCIGACCRQNTVMELTDTEVDFLEEKGTRLSEWEPETGILRRILPLLGQSVTRRYLLKTDCGYLERQEEKSICSAYDNPKHPSICRDFKAGSAACRVFRYVKGVDDEETFRKAMGSSEAIKGQPVRRL